MKFSKNWLQEYSVEPLPDIATLQNTITFNAFEVEDTFVVQKSQTDAEQTQNNAEETQDEVLDIKVLPNRAHDALGHRGMGRDVCAILGTTFRDPHEYYRGEGDKNVQPPIITIEDTKACTRFMSVRIDGVTVTDSPEWLKFRLQAIGQKSINSIVDITNYVQFAINKPMHAYDASLVSNNTLSARFATSGEVLTTLDEKSLTLDETTLVIADTEKPLGLAGIKGGKFSGISTETSSIILESANFNPTLIRKTSQKYGLRTDASKRFENEISDELIEEGLRMTIALVQKLNPQAKVSVIVDVWNRTPWTYTVSVSPVEVNAFLGTSYTNEEMSDALTRIGCTVEQSTVRAIIEKKLLEASHATYKNPSSMREDAPKAFSCSSFISFLFSGIWQPSISIDKYVYMRPVDKEEAVWGDLVFSNTGNGAIRYESVNFLSGTKVESGIDHVGLYVGENQVTHISKRTNAIVTEDIAISESFKSGVVYARLVDVNKVRLFVTIPHERLDLRIKEDVIEEIVRVRGLSSIKGVLPKLDRIGIPHKRIYYENKIKNILYAHGFSDVITYSFGDVGDVEIMKGLATDKEKLRTMLARGITNAFQMNMLNAPLINIQTVKMYEFGNVFTKETERRHLALVLDDGKKKTSFTDDMDLVLSEIKRTLGVAHIDYETVSVKPYVIELDFDTLIEQLPDPAQAGDGPAIYEPLSYDTREVSFQPISPYPFITRDIAVWVPVSVTWEDLHALALQIDSPLIARIDCFDTFTKEVEGMTKTSFAFRFVLQSHSRTLTDDEANDVANRMYALLKEKGYEIR